MEGMGRNNARREKGTTKTVSLGQASQPLLLQAVNSTSQPGIQPPSVAPGVLTVFMLFSLESVALPVPRRELAPWASIFVAYCCYKSPQTQWLKST